MRHVLGRASKSLKTSAAAFEGLITSQPSAAAFEGVPLAWPWYLPRLHKLFLLGFENCYVARFGQASKAPAACLAMVPRFSWASKLLCGTFWAGLKSLKTSAAAFEGLRTSQPSAAAFEGVPLAWTWYLPRPHKLFLLGFETAMWHILGRHQSLKTSAAAFEGLINPQASAAAFEGVPLAWP